MFAFLFKGLLTEIQEEIYHFAGLGRGGFRGTKIVNKTFVNKLAFPNQRIPRFIVKHDRPHPPPKKNTKAVGVFVFQCFLFFLIFVVSALVFAFSLCFSSLKATHPVRLPAFFFVLSCLHPVLALRQALPHCKQRSFNCKQKSSPTPSVSEARSSQTHCKTRSSSAIRKLPTMFRVIFPPPPTPRLLIFHLKLGQKGKSLVRKPDSPQ